MQGNETMKKEYLTLGIDSGSTTTKAVLFDGKNIVKKAIIATSANPKESMERIYKQMYQEEVRYVIATGYGRELLQEADKKVTEITCHAKGAAFLCEDIGAVIDIGGQDCKAILLDQDQNVIDFLMNDKCSAGTGRFIEVISRVLGQKVETITEFTKGKNPVSISSMCTVFAESEVVSLLAKGEDAGDILLGIIHSICRRTAIFAQKLPLEGEIFFSGGLAQNEVFQNVLSYYLKKEVKTHELSQFAGAIGAAVIGWGKMKKNNSKKKGQSL